MKHVQKNISWLSIGITLSLFIISGCSKTSQPIVQALDVPAVANPIESHDDIVLPPGMEWERDKSMAIKTASFSGGLYYYSGRIELHSLKDYIKRSMANNNWKLVGGVSSGETMYAFIKPNKTCMVTISDGPLGFFSSTVVKLYVAVDLAAAKGLNPFGEPVN